MLDGLYLHLLYLPLFFKYCLFYIWHVMNLCISIIKMVPCYIITICEKTNNWLEIIMYIYIYMWFITPLIYITHCHARKKTLLPPWSSKVSVLYCSWSTYLYVLAVHLKTSNMLSWIILLPHMTHDPLFKVIQAIVFRSWPLYWPLYWELLKNIGKLRIESQLSLVVGFNSYDGLCWNRYPVGTWYWMDRKFKWLSEPKHFNGSWTFNSV